MIVTHLVGGLGNQMFQYAAGRALALRRGADLRLDRSAFGTTERRAYGLDAFALKAVEAGPGDLPSARRSLRDRLLAKHRPRRHQEAGLGFCADVLDLPDGSYLEGYWQSERYFRDQDAAIRADFTLRAPPRHESLPLLARAEAQNSVSLHVRRGDYASDPTVQAVHGTCPPAYYAEAVALLKPRVGGDLVGFIFSDDHDWVRANLSLPIETVHVEHNGAEHAHEDLRLMSACRHHVIANSTFSWWGAWLDARDGGSVVAPARWFAADHLDGSDIVPERWIRI